MEISLNGATIDCFLVLLEYYLDLGAFSRVGHHRHLVGNPFFHHEGCIYEDFTIFLKSIPAS